MANRNAQGDGRAIQRAMSGKKMFDVKKGSSYKRDYMEYLASLLDEDCSFIVTSSGMSHMIQEYMKRLNRKSIRYEVPNERYEIDRIRYK